MLGHQSMEGDEIKFIQENKTQQKEQSFSERQAIENFTSVLRTGKRVKDGNFYVIKNSITRAFQWYPACSENPFYS